MELRQEQKLKQTLSQNMLQSTEILQMGQLELKEYLEDLALENPVEIGRASCRERVYQLV